ncbi:hypothetical protein [Streptomyces sp. NPDC051567]|uniref:hypothetical protein n=1 Tax=Streptomyces sp. NPDC051567 TaxID=3365660 RepID=UPI0037B59390
MAQHKGCLIGCAVALVVGLGVLAALTFGAVKLVDMADKVLLDPKVYQEIEAGDTESQVRGRLPSGETVLKTGLKEGGPAEPQGSVCSWYLSSADAKGGEETVFRFCFKDGRLAGKAEYHLK